jgi:hypothetical protein
MGLATLAFACLLAPRYARAGDHDKADRKPYALIFGTVWAPDGNPVYAVKVKIRRSDDTKDDKKGDKKARWELLSNHTGEFAQRVPAGKADYIVWAEVKDYKLESGKHFKPGPEVTVHVENDERVDTGIHLDW